MSVSPRFSVTPKIPHAGGYDFAKGEWTHYADLRAHGVFVDTWPPSNLSEQCSKDKIVLRKNPWIDPWGSVPDFMSRTWYRYSVAYLSFLTNATTKNQYLLEFHVSGSQARASFYINGNRVRVESVDGDDVISILVDCPPPHTWWYVYMFLANWGYLVLKKIKCYIR